MHSLKLFTIYPGKVGEIGRSCFLLSQNKKLTKLFVISILLWIHLFQLRNSLNHPCNKPSSSNIPVSVCKLWSFTCLKFSEILLYFYFGTQFWREDRRWCRNYINRTLKICHKVADLFFTTHLYQVSTSFPHWIPTVTLLTNKDSTLENQAHVLVPVLNNHHNPHLICHVHHGYNLNNDIIFLLQFPWSTQHTQK